MNDPVLDSLRQVIRLAGADLAGARAQIRGLVATHPNHPETRSLAGTLAKEAGDLPEAITHFTRAAELRPAQPEHALSLAQVQFQKGDLLASVKTTSALLEGRPDLLQAWQLLARILSRMGRIEDAQGALSQAMKRAPKDPGIRYQMGNILFQKGDFPAALEHFEIAHAEFPESPEILNDLGSNRLALGDVDGAVGAFRLATEVRPDFAMAWANLGGALSYKGELSTPLKAFLKATKLAPNDHRIWLKMGRTLVNSGHLETAEKCLRRVLKQRPDNRRARATLGTVLERTHRYEEAIELLQPLIEAGINDSSAAVAWATTCRRLGRTAEAIPVIEGYLESNRSQPERVLLAHTLGDLYEKNGQHAEAFAVHAQANEEHDLSFDPEHYRRSVEKLIRAFEPESFGRRARASKSDPTPVLIVGMPRSGTSLVEQIIDCHSQAAGAGELESLRHLSGSLGRAVGELNWQVAMDGLTTERADKLSKAYLDKLRETDGSAQRITDKMPVNFLNLGLAAHILPGARVIHCVRDPLDTAISCYFKLFNFGYAFSTRQEWLGHFTLGYRELMAHWEKVLPLPILPVRYEELVDDLEGGTRRILDFLDLPWEDGCLRFHENTRVVRTASYAQVRQPIYRSSMGRAQPYLEWIGPLIETLGGGKTGLAG